MIVLNFKSLQENYQKKSRNFDKNLLRIPLKESHEEFLYLPTLFDDNKLEIVFKDKKTSYLRKTIAFSLVKSVKHFKKLGFAVRLESVYRSIDEQKNRFTKRYLSIKEDFPDKLYPELLEIANTYTAGIPILAAHTGGAAVDVTLLDYKGRLLDFGVPYPHGGIESTTDYPHLARKVKENRKILKDGMEKYGFVNYPFEYWHYSMGDVCATHLTGKKFAKFGPVNYNANNNKIVYMKIKKELYKYFTI